MNKWLINKRPHEDLNQNPVPSTSQNVSRPECVDTNEQPKGKIKKLEKLTNESKTKKENMTIFKIRFYLDWKLRRALSTVRCMF